jgi:rare lipoprotein A
MARRTSILIFVAATVAITGCAHKKKARIGVPPPLVGPGYTETGVASWYGYPYHGRRAANGEIYDMEKMTAAHRTLPFETWVLVTNLKNEKQVEVRITDRGPFIDGRIIDLSHAAAKEIDLIGPGVGPVRLQVISRPAKMPEGAYAVQVGAFRDRQAADRVRTEMGSRYGSARLVLRAGNPDLWRVLVGGESTEDAAGALQRRIEKDSGERNSAFVVRIDSEDLR